MDKIEYKYGNDEITVYKDIIGVIHVYEDKQAMEVEFHLTEANKALEVLENIYNFLLTDSTGSYVDVNSYNGEDEWGEETGEWYWTDDLMYDKDINPYFSPGDSFTGNCLYRDELPYVIKAIQEYLNPKDISNIDNLTLRSILKLRRNLTNDN